MTVLGNVAEIQEIAKSARRSICLHCGAPVRKAAEEFCCAGCEFVYRSINSLGLAGFYRLREADEKSRADKVEPQKAYTYLDDPQLAKKILSIDARGMSLARFYLPTIHCAACVWLLEKLPEVIKGVSESRVSFRSGNIEVCFDSSVISLSELARVLNSIGYPPVPATHDAMLEEYKKEDRALLRRIGVAAVCAANTMMLADSLFQGSFTGIEEPYRSLLTWASAIITLPAVLYSAYPFYRAALGALVVGSLHIDIPISLAILFSYAGGIVHTVRGDTFVFFDSITSLIFLLLIARYAQRRAIHRARASTLTAWDLFPGVVRVCQDGKIFERAFREMLVGDVVEVLPGERIPSDGEVLSGNSSIESSFLTGESRPQKVAPGSSVLGGSINLEQKLRLRVDALGDNTRLGRIIAGLETSRDKRSVLESRVNDFTNAFVLAVLIASVATFVVWYVVDRSRAFDIAISMLIVLCPCALGLAIPTAITVALSRAQRLGIFVKNSEALQTLARAQHFYFDKTGTLTEGRIAVSGAECGARERLLAIALASCAPLHPVARAISELPHTEMLPELKSVRHVPGKGVQAESLLATQLCLGSYKWIRERQVVIPPLFESLLNAWQQEGASVCLLDEDGVVTAVFKLSDNIRPAAIDFVSHLRQQGKEVFILSGDSQLVVNRIADVLQIPRASAHGELSPEDKSRLLQSDQSLTAMIGDGLNDADAISKSSVGIGLSGGIEATLECADIFISEDGLAGVRRLYDGAAATEKVIRRNLVYSVVYNVIGGGLAVFGYITPLLAAVLMPLSSLTVILSSALSTYFKKPEIE